LNKHTIKQLLREVLSKESYQYQIRDIGGSDVFYKKKKNQKLWTFIDKDEYDENANKNNTVKYKN
jgi:hypothetical protein